jgi:hypothetical protein
MIDASESAVGPDNVLANLCDSRFDTVTHIFSLKENIFFAYLPPPPAVPFFLRTLQPH